jgi:heme-degrading monooxygenase HmoA
LRWRVASGPAQIRPTQYEEEAVETLYTHTTWNVKPDMEDEFVRRWSEWAEWSHREGLNAPALLLRDLENPRTFISFGPWQSATAVKNWRALAGYHERVARLREVVDRFEPRTLEVTARV